MENDSDQRPVSDDAEKFTVQNPDGVRRSLIQLGDMRHIYDEMAQLSERIRKDIPSDEKSDSALSRY